MWMHLRRCLVEVNETMKTFPFNTKEKKSAIM